MLKDIKSLFDCFLHCLEQMGNSPWCGSVIICSLLAVLWEKKTWVSMAITVVQQSKRRSKPAQIRLKMNLLHFQVFDHASFHFSGGELFSFYGIRSPPMIPSFGS